jgi:hypothetical protein
MRHDFDINNQRVPRFFADIHIHRLEVLPGLTLRRAVNGDSFQLPRSNMTLLD